MDIPTVTKVCILAAGMGSRLGSLTSDINKCLLPLADSTALTLILQQFPASLPVIIAIGYKASLVRSYCEAVHSERDFTFVVVDPYEGEGAGPGYSLECCRTYLTGPFYLTTADCLVVEPIPVLQESWIGVCDNNYSGLYSTARISASGQVLVFQNKSAHDYEQAFIGLAYIHEPDVFWSELGKLHQKDREAEFVSAWYHPEHYTSLRALQFTWMDTGCKEGYAQTQDHFGSARLGMNKRISELTVSVNGVLCKLCPDVVKNRQRIARARLLFPHVPDLSYTSDTACAYRWIDGETLYERDNFYIYRDFLDWCERELWSKKLTTENFGEDCRLFYQEKTRRRYADYVSREKDLARIVNGLACLPVHSYLGALPWFLLREGIPVIFHGDLQFENVLIDTDEKYRLIDWRESFGGREDAGDLYYDLAKMYGGILLPYNHIETAADSLVEAEVTCTYTLQRTEALTRLQPIFEQWVLDHGYDLRRVQLITALVWLNMAPLHVGPADRLLFAQAQWMLASLRSNLLRTDAAPATPDLQECGR